MNYICNGILDNCYPFLENFTIYHEHIKNSTFDKLSNKRMKQKRMLLENSLLDSIQFDYILDNTYDPILLHTT